MHQIGKNLKVWKYHVSAWNVEMGNLYTSRESINGQTASESNLPLSNSGENFIPYNAAIPLLSIYQIDAYIHAQGNMTECTAAL